MTQMILPKVEKIIITSVVDNYLDPLLQDEGPAKRRNIVKKKSFERCLCSEHGLAEHLESWRDGKSFKVLFDFSATDLVYLHNLQLLEQDYGFELNQIDTLILSHGHWDHYGGLPGFLNQRRDDLAAETRLYSGPDSFYRRRSSVTALGRRTDSGVLDQEFIESKKVDVVKIKEPMILGNQLMISGPIERKTEYEAKDFTGQVEVDGNFEIDTLAGEQAIIYNLKNCGLVILTACGHAGVVNTVLHAQKVTGIQKIHAIIGGFHLSGASADLIDKTVSDLCAFDPDYIFPMHCTGMETIGKLKTALGGRIIYNSAGTRYELS